MLDREDSPERIDLRVILRGALDTEELSLEHDTLVVSFELKRRVAEDIRAAIDGAPDGAHRPENASPHRT
jgi:hypothetical protein